MPSAAQARTSARPASVRPGPVSGEGGSGTARRGRRRSAGSRPGRASAGRRRGRRRAPPGRGRSPRRPRSAAPRPGCRRRGSGQRGAVGDHGHGAVARGRQPVRAADRAGGERRRLRMVDRLGIRHVPERSAVRGVVRRRCVDGEQTAGWNTCISSSRSPRTTAASSLRDRVSVTPARFARGSKVCATSVSTTPSSTSSESGRYSRISTRLNDRRSSTRRDMRSACSAMIFRKRSRASASSLALPCRVST